jgi:hypothetical protein
MYKQAARTLPESIRCTAESLHCTNKSLGCLPESLRYIGKSLSCTAKSLPCTDKSLHYTRKLLLRWGKSLTCIVESLTCTWKSLPLHPSHLSVQRSHSPVHPSRSRGRVQRKEPSSGRFLGQRKPSPIPGKVAAQREGFRVTAQPSPACEKDSRPLRYPDAMPRKGSS